MRILENKTVKEKAYFEELENGLKVIIIPKENTNKKNGNNRYKIWFNR